MTVQDTISPQAVCQNITVYLDGSGNATITTGDLDNGSSDNCGPISYSASRTSFTCADLGNNNVTLTVTDNHMNSSSCVSSVMVVDTTLPFPICQEITVYLDGTGNASITAGDLDNGSTDNCGIASYALSQTSFTCADIGPNEVTLTVFDGSLNSRSCNGTVTIIDTTSPVAVCQDITVFLDQSGTALDCGIRPGWWIN